MELYKNQEEMTDLKIINRGNGSIEFHAQALPYINKLLYSNGQVTIGLNHMVYRDCYLTIELNHLVYRDCYLTIEPNHMVYRDCYLTIEPNHMVYRDCYLTIEPLFFNCFYSYSYRAEYQDFTNSFKINIK